MVGLFTPRGTSLFLLNPNGILFGPNARLDIDSSFLATTANAFTFANGSEFSATNPQAPPLLMLNVAPGLQWGSGSGATITNRGNLSAGQDLSLEASQLDLQGQLIAGRDLDLTAKDTVKIRDTTVTPFLAQSSRDLTIHGNQAIDILALNHPSAALQSGKTLTLISDGPISGDAHFRSGDRLLLQTLTGTPGHFVSWFDPIIYATGDVAFGDYVGTALKVEAGGRIEGGNITIIGPDATIPSTDPDVAIWEHVIR
jgi:adhesin HecA-like repeat protein